MKLAAKWNGYWFRPWPVVDLATVRIFAVGMQVWLMTHWGLDSQRQLAAVPDEFYQPLYLIQILTFGSGYRPPLELLQIVWYAGLASGALALVGLMTNASLVVFAVASTLIHAHGYSFGSIHHPPAVMVIALWALAFSPSGRVLSLDALLRRGGGARAPDDAPWYQATSRYSRWPILMLQWFFVTMYISAVYNKGLNGGLEWANGYTLQYYLIMDGLRWDSPLAVWLAQFHTLVLVSQWGVLLFQATFALPVIFPRLRWIYVPAGLALHVGILLTLKAPFYQWIALYAIFIPWSDVFAMLDRRVRTWRAEHAPTTAATSAQAQRAP